MKVRPPTRPGHLSFDIERGDYVCLTDAIGNRVTDWTMIPESGRVTLPSTDHDGLLYIGFRDPMRDEVFCWGANLGGPTSFTRHETVVLATPDADPATEPEAKPQRKSWWRRAAS